jgi:hypothetical protein
MKIKKYNQLNNKVKFINFLQLIKELEKLKENNIKLNYRLLNNEVMQVNNIKYQRGGF